MARTTAQQVFVCVELCALHSASSMGVAYFHASHEQQQQQRQPQCDMLRQHQYQVQQQHAGGDGGGGPLFATLGARLRWPLPLPANVGCSGCPGQAMPAAPAPGAVP